MWFSIFLHTLLAATAVEPAKPSPESRLNEVVARLQKTWDATKSYKSGFKQVVFSKRMGTRDEHTGVLYVVKPGKLRWESVGDGGIQILNGKKLFSITENKRRGNRVVDIYNDVRKAMDTSSLNFLSGRSKFKELYEIKMLSESDKLAELRLTPKTSATETFVAEIDKSSYFLRSLTTENADTRVRIDFSDIKTNVPLDEKLFDFKPGPKDIIHEQ